MSLYGTNVEYALHCLLYLVDLPAETHVGSRDLAEFQGISPSLVAKLFTRLQKSGIVSSTAGIRGGYRLARRADTITVHDVVRAVDGDQPLFKCREIRANCILNDGKSPDQSRRGICSIHAVMLQAEERMFAELKRHTLAGLAATVEQKTSPDDVRQKRRWFEARELLRQTPARLRSAQKERNS